MSASQPANFNLQEFSDAGLPLAGGRLYTYAFGTTAQKVAYTDPEGAVPHTYTGDGNGGQYIALNARGELPTPLYLALGPYDLTLRRPDGSTVWTRKAEGVDAVADLSLPDGVLEVGNATDKRALRAASGAAMVGFRETTADARLKESVSIQDYGGKDDFGNVLPTDNAVALAKVTAAFPNGCIIRFPRTNTASYDFLSYGAGNLNNYVYDVDEGVTLRFPNNAMTGQQLARFLRDTTCYFKDMNLRYVMKSSFSNTGQARYETYKSQFLGPGDRDTTLVSPIDLSRTEVEAFDLPWPDGPFANSAAIGKTARKADISLATGNTGFKFVAIPVIPGAEVSCWFESPVGWDGFYAFGVATQNGYDVLYESMVPGTGASRMAKEFGSASVNSNVPYRGSGDHYSTWAKNGICTVRCIAHNSFVVLVNGVERYRSRGTASPIRSIILGAGYGTAAATVSVRDVIIAKNKQTAGQKPIKIMTIGDSITDGQIHGNWPNFMGEALEGTMGIRVSQVRNIAVSGANAVAQYATLLTADISDIDVACILIGVNDIQGGTDPVASFIANVALMLDRLNGAGIPCVVGVPTQFYSRALGAASTAFDNQGQNTTNYEKGAPYRGRLIYEVASRNPAMNRLCFGTLEDLGPVLSDWLVANEGLDSIVYDNIHPTSHARRLMGYAMARSVAGLLAPLVQRSYPRTRFQASWLLNGWADTGGAPSIEITESGSCFHNGLIDKDAGSLADGTEIFALPPYLWPTLPIQVPALVTGAGLNAVARILISADGRAAIYGAPPGTTGIYLDSLRYKLNW